MEIIRKQVRWVTLKFIRFYQLAISPYHMHCCRYEPTCSSYAYQAIQKYGMCRGGFIALKRLIRCHPFHAGGYDPLL